MDLARLNPPQRAAVTHGSGPLLVLAGAGSGKTRVITYRIAHLMGRGVDPRHIAALTFTNKAAREMRERISLLLGDRKRAGLLSMGTFHSLGLSILRAERKALGFPRGFVIYDGADQIGVVRELMRTIHIGDRRLDPKAILTRISLAKNAFVAPDEFDPAECDEYDEMAAEIYPRYQRALKAFAAVDFDDLITEVVHLFESNEEVRMRWQKKFRHVLVDEYQDTNRAQLMMVKHLVADHSNLCVVGDDDQSIYSWRGADPANILGFDRSFPGAEIVKLEQNYRSTPTILAAANAVIANNVQRHGKELWSERPDGDRLAHVVAPDIASEAKFVGREIERVKTEEQRPYKDFAILYRSNIQTRILEEELRTMQVPYVMYGGQQFFERKEVKDLIAYMRVALNPRDEISLRRVINYPARGIGATTLERLGAWSQAHHTPLWNGLERAATIDGIGPRPRRAIAGLVAVVNELAGTLDRGESPAQAARALMDRIDLYSDLRAASPSLTAAQRRIDNVESLLRSLERHQERKPGRRALSEYLRQLSLANEEEKEEAGDRVVLTTLHGAKGLEFPVVFLIGLEEELLPHARTLMPHATDVIDPDHASDVSEERRLAYVGITRAKEKLYLSRVLARRRHGKMSPRTPSRFLMEIPKDLIEERDIAAEGAEEVAADEVSAFFQNFAFD